MYNMCSIATVETIILVGDLLFTIWNSHLKDLLEKLFNTAIAI